MHKCAFKRVLSGLQQIEGCVLITLKRVPHGVRWTKHLWVVFATSNAWETNPSIEKGV